MRFLLSEPDKNVKDNAYLQIAWKVNAATLGLSPTKIKRGLFNRNTIMLYDIPKFCQLLENEQESMLLRTKARLLYGASKIMRQKTLFLYDDSLQLYSKVQIAMAVPSKTDHINLERPMTSSLSITLKEKDDLLEYQTSFAAPLSELFDFTTNAKSRRVNHDDIEEDLCSILKMTNSLSINLPQTESEFPEMFLPSFTDNQYFGGGGDQEGSPNNNGAAPSDAANNGIDNHHIQDPFDSMMDYGDDEGYFNDGGRDILAHDNNMHPPPNLAETNQQHYSSALMDDSVFDYPNTLNATDIMNRSTSSHSSNSSTSTNAAVTAGPTSHYSGGIMTGGHHRHPMGSGNGGDHVEQLPSLIREEDENTVSSISTEMYPGIISYNCDEEEEEEEEEQNDIVISPVPPERHRPRIVQRMMLQNEADTMLPWSAYNAETITRREDEDHQVVVKPPLRKKNRLQLVQNQIRFPSIVVFNPYQKEFIETSLMEEGVYGMEKFAQSVINDGRYKLFFPHVNGSHYEMNDDNTERHTRARSYTEIARRADHRLRNALGNSSSSGSNSQERVDGLGSYTTTGIRSHVSLRSSSDLTAPDIHHIDFEDLDNMQDGRNEGNDTAAAAPPPSFGEEAMDDFQDDPIDYEYLNFENNFQGVLNDTNPPMTDIQARIINEENGLRDFEEELHLFVLSESQNHIDINSLFQVKNRYEVAKSFYYLLDLVSKNKIKASQTEAFGSIDVHFV